jgi:hypothetical protein
MRPSQHGAPLGQRDSGDSELDVSAQRRDLGPEQLAGSREVGGRLHDAHPPLIISRHPPVPLAPPSARDARSGSSGARGRSLGLAKACPLTHRVVTTPTSRGLRVFRRKIVPRCRTDQLGAGCHHHDGRHQEHQPGGSEQPARPSPPALRFAGRRVRLDGVHVTPRLDCWLMPPRCRVAVAGPMALPPGSIRGLSPHQHRAGSGPA